MMLKLIFGLVAIVVPGIVQAQAFGVRMGAPVSQYGGKPVEGSRSSFVIRVPDPNNEFESYLAVATPETGVCKVSGVGKTHKNDDYGTETRAVFEAMRGSLASKYGNSKLFDFIRPGALWKEPREWVWSIFKKERTLASFWDSEERSTLPSPITSIALSTKAIDSSGAYVTIQYEFSNFDICHKSIGAQSDKGL